MSYHINPNTGRPNFCRADSSNPNSRGCPYKSETGETATHYSSKKEARTSYEKENSSQNLISISKKDKKNIIEYPKIYIDPIPNSSNLIKNYIESFRNISRAPLESEISYLKAVYNGEIPEELSSSVLRKNNELNFSGTAFHQSLVNGGYFAKINKKFVKNLIKELGKDPVVLDCFAGKGYLTKALQDEGIKAIATDNNSRRLSKGIEKLDALDAIKKYGKNLTHVAIVWAEDNTDHKILKKISKEYPHIKIINIGEFEGGCTGSDSFWNEIDKKDYTTKNIPYDSTFGINDYCTIIEID